MVALVRKSFPFPGSVTFGSMTCDILHAELGPGTIFKSLSCLGVIDFRKSGRQEEEIMHAENGHNLVAQP
jgi:hypothetical protein